ncbi:zinc finger CCCH domain-containing protein 3 isoform X1 [Punica granatum]|uniref:Zinc finger CCCH domain-containing protein 3 isoform X1 n=1 Tax=Punica granatum TaxID=22663 RepID=A0A6P8D8H2_PUNGR|nr:zinc finger CCCH domain-containing protein 3 isoform X1 [Punica granatum]
MPVGKYYCDYCDKQFQDTHFSRKRHLQGLQHLRARALWYDSIRSSSSSESTQTYAEGILKGACNRFLKTGFCPYGDSCKYVHPKNIRGPNSQLPPENKQAAMILGSQLAAGALSQGDVVTNIMGIAWGNLPPSLKPPPEGGYPPLPFLDWG